MTTISFTWEMEILPTTDDRGRKQCNIIERTLGADAEDRTFGPMPCVVAEAFIRTRRERVRTLMYRNGGIKLLVN